MKGLIDTNLLIYATNESSPEYSRARSFLETALREPSACVTTWLNIAEYLSFTTQSFSGQPPLLTIEEALRNVKILIGSGGFRIITEGEEHWSFWSKILEDSGVVKGPFVHDCRIVAIMLENGIETIFTGDADFQKIEGLKVVNPFRAGNSS